MTQFTISVPDNKIGFIMELLKNLGIKKVEKLKEGQELDEIPAWHKSIIDKRLADKKMYPDKILDFDQVMDDIESEL